MFIRFISFSFSIYPAGIVIHNINSRCIVSCWYRTKAPIKTFIGKFLTREIILPAIFQNILIFDLTCYAQFIIVWLRLRSSQHWLFSFSNWLPCLKLGLPILLSNVICGNCLSLFKLLKRFQFFLLHLNLKMYCSVHGGKIHFALWYWPVKYFQLYQ